MLERKNIDRVFQENLKDLEIFPHKRVWTQIAQELEERPARSRSMLWKRLAGVAAVLAVLFSGALFYYTSDEAVPESNTMTSTEAEPDKAEPLTPANPEAISTGSVLVQNVEEKTKPVAPSMRQKVEPLVVKNDHNLVIVTNNEIATVYSNLDNKYIVDQEDFIRDLKSEESITDRIASIPVKKEANTIEKKWSVGPTIAPVYFNSIQEGSPVTGNLSENAKSSDNSLSVGVKVNYQLNDKFYIQSGINKVELAYNTKDVTAFISSSKNAPSNINSSKPGVYLTPATGVKRDISSPENALYKSNLQGDLNQSIEYFELPIEMKYNLYDKRLGLNLVGGFSTFILYDNSLSLISGSGSTDLGDANNLNDLNFSGNFGVDLDYKISKSWYLNVAPMFKYQFNTYSGSSGNFRPYYFGLYSGLNYKF